MVSDLDSLWQALAAMRVGREDARLTFEARLARENDWSAGHAAAVMGEYRRFLYLAATAGPVTPSEDIDQAWHLHLSYSRHYWEVLCGTIVGRALHHEPTAGGAAAQARYRDQYEDTLRRYRCVFGEAPPPGIWPDAASRFAARPLRIDATRYWLVPKALGGRAAALTGATLMVAACAGLAANATGDSGGGVSWWDIIGITFVTVFVIVAALGIGEKWGDRSDRRDGGGGSGCGGGCGD